MKSILCKALALVTIITSVSCPVFASENGGQTHDDVIIIREDVNHDEAASDLTYNPYIAETLIPCGTISGNVNESEINPDVQLRTEEEIAAIYDELHTLFPEEYHYVLAYDENGVDSTIMLPEIIFEDTRNGNEASYTLTVYNNRQVLLGIEKDLTEMRNVNNANAYDSHQVTKVYQLGDLGHYTTFTVVYTVNLYSYDVIDSCTEGGSGFYLYPYNRRFKQYEDSNGNAYKAYVNSSMNYDGSGVLYDLGVVVGNDSSKGVCRISTGIDAFISYLLNPFIWN